MLTKWGIFLTNLFVIQGNLKVNQAPLAPRALKTSFGSFKFQLAQIYESWSIDSCVDTESI